MTEEFNLSEKEQMILSFEDKIFYYRKEDVKEFIKRIKKELHKRDLDNYIGLCYSIKDIEDGKGIVLSKWIDKLLRDKLI